MSIFVKGELFVLAIIDACPEPIDDILVLMLRMAARKKFDTL